MNLSKDRSPFSPGRPVPPELFVGREQEIERILRAARQVAAGKQENIFITGEYGIGKSSLASYIRYVAQEKHGLVGFHVFLGTVSTVEQMVVQVISRIIEQTHQEKMFDRVKGFLGKYVEEVELFGVRFNLDALRHDAPAVAHGFLPFLRQVGAAFDDRYSGVTLILDDPNGLTANPEFAAMLKSIVDEIATSGCPLPLLLILNGVPERRAEILQHHRSVERIFNIAEVSPLEDRSVAAFLRKAFGGVGMTIEDYATALLVRYSGGLPKLMHELGDAAYWTDQDGDVSADDASDAVVMAADTVGRKYFDPVYQALRSTQYRSILRKLGRLDFDLSFQRADVAKGLTETEKRSFDNFLQRMRQLNALRPGDLRGEWVFPNRLIRVYLLLESQARNG